MKLPVSVARRNSRGESAARKKCVPRERGRKLEHRAARSQRGGSAVVDFGHFFLLFLYNIYNYWARCQRGGKFKLSALLRQAVKSICQSIEWLVKIIEDHWRSLKITWGHWRSLKIIEDHWRPMKIVEDHWSSLKIIEDHLRSLKVIKDRCPDSFPVDDFFFTNEKNLQNYFGEN